MKYYAIFLILITVNCVQAAEVKVSGMRAQVLMSSALELDMVDSIAAGHSRLEIQGLLCEKKLSADFPTVNCTAQNVVTSQKPNSIFSFESGVVETAPANVIRTLLAEVTSAEVVVNAKIKRIGVKSIKCESKNEGLIFDSITIERESICTIQY